MNTQTFNLSNKIQWKEYVNKFDNIDFHFHSDYHDLYKLRYGNSEPIMWVYENENNLFIYPFNITRIDLDIDKNKKYFDISSSYGFLGPASNTNNKEFILQAWIEFDKWAMNKNIVLEFIRFNPLLDNQNICHKDTSVEFNRLVGVSDLRGGKPDFINKIPSKTRNMIRKAIKNDFKTTKINFNDVKKDFMNLYLDTMKRNKSTSFFDYDSDYFDKLAKFNETKFYGVYKGKELVAGGIFFASNNIATYHLGACKKEFLTYGLSNLYLYDATMDFIKKNFLYINLAGGRTTSPEDSLLRFKRDNSTDLKKFFIGKRIINKEIYNYIINKFNLLKKNDKFIFYRS